MASKIKEYFRPSFGVQAPERPSGANQFAKKVRPASTQRPPNHFKEVEKAPTTSNVHGFYRSASANNINASRTDVYLPEPVPNLVNGAKEFGNTLRRSSTQGSNLPESVRIARQRSSTQGSGSNLPDSVRIARQRSSTFGSNLPESVRIARQRPSVQGSQKEEKEVTKTTKRSKIKGFFRPLGGYLRPNPAFGGQFNGQKTIRDIEQPVVNKTPTVHVPTSGSSSAPDELPRGRQNEQEPRRTNSAQGSRSSSGSRSRQRHRSNIRSVPSLRSIREEPSDPQEPSTPSRSSSRSTSRSSSRRHQSLVLASQRLCPVLIVDGANDLGTEESALALAPPPGPVDVSRPFNVSSAMRNPRLYHPVQQLQRSPSSDYVVQTYVARHPAAYSNDERWKRLGYNKDYSIALQPTYHGPTSCLPPISVAPAQTAAWTKHLEALEKAQVKVIPSQTDTFELHQFPGKQYWPSGREWIPSIGPGAIQYAEGGGFDDAFKRSQSFKFKDQKTLVAMFEQRRKDIENGKMRVVMGKTREEIITPGFHPLVKDYRAPTREVSGVEYRALTAGKEPEFKDWESTAGELSNVKGTRVNEVSLQSQHVRVGYTRQMSARSVHSQYIEIDTVESRRASDARSRMSTASAPRHSGEGNPGTLDSTIKQALSTPSTSRPSSIPIPSGSEAQTPPTTTTTPLQPTGDVPVPPNTISCAVVDRRLSNWLASRSTSSLEEPSTTQQSSTPIPSQSKPEIPPSTISTTVPRVADIPPNTTPQRLFPNVPLTSERSSDPPLPSSQPAIPPPKPSPAADPEQPTSIANVRSRSNSSSSSRSLSQSLADLSLNPASSRRASEPVSQQPGNQQRVSEEAGSFRSIPYSSTSPPTDEETARLYTAPSRPQPKKLVKKRRHTNGDARSSSSVSGEEVGDFGEVEGRKSSSSEGISIVGEGEGFRSIAYEETAEPTEEDMARLYDPTSLGRKPTNTSTTPAPKPQQARSYTPTPSPPPPQTTNAEAGNSVLPLRNKVDSAAEAASKSSNGFGFVRGIEVEVGDNSLRQREEDEEMIRRKERRSRFVEGAMSEHHSENENDNGHGNGNDNGNGKDKRQENENGKGEKWENEKKVKAEKSEKKRKSWNRMWSR